jgi:hypothetical protein
MYFAEGVTVAIASLMATHPPLPARIRRLDPQWDGMFPPPLPADAIAGMSDRAAAGLVGAPLYGDARTVPVDVVEHAVDQVGDPQEYHREYIRELLAAMPPLVTEAVHEPYGARAVIYATLLDRNQQIRNVQLQALQQHAQPDVFQLTLKLLPSVDAVDVRARLPLVDMAMPALRAMSRSQFQTFAACFQKLVDADKRIGLFEWTLHQILLRHLRPQFERIQSTRIHYYGLQKLGQPCSVLLSALSHASNSKTELAFRLAAKELPNVSVNLLPTSACGLVELHHALRELTKVAPKHRARLVDACATAICADAEVNLEEAELLRAICDMLDCPMPPLLPGQKVSRAPRATAVS